MNDKEFIERFQEFLLDNNLSASALAAKIDVQKSSISHLLSGRNKPSLDFVTKLIKHYPSLDLYWLLEGRSRSSSASNNASAQVDSKPVKNGNFSLFDDIKPDALPKNEPSNVLSKGELFSNSDKTISKIIILYRDNSFDEFKPNK